MVESYAQKNQEEIRRQLHARFLGCHRLINISVQFDVEDMDICLILCRRMKDRFLRVIHRSRVADIPFVGCVEVKGHQHAHLLTVLPDDMSEHDIDVRMRDIFRNTRGLKSGYNQYSISEDGDYEWKQYITKYEDFRDEVVWL